MDRYITINQRRVGSGEPTYIIAEMSANHNQDLDVAVQIIHAAKEAGADAVKLQTYTADTLTIPSDREWFRIGGGTLWDGHTLHALYQKAYMPWKWHTILQQVADEIGITLFSTAYDSVSIEFLEAHQVPVHKVASFELVDIPLIEQMARTGKPLILSTGMATLSEIDEAVHAARRAGAQQVALLKCTSAYPAPPQEMNLRTISHLADAFNVPVGLSDHTTGIAVPVVAVAQGACIIEKHITLSRQVPGPDSAFSLEPAEFQTLVDAVRVAEKSLGSICYNLGDKENASRLFRRSLFVISDVKAGEIFTDQNVRSIRPSQGLHPRHLPDVLGRRATQDISTGTPLRWDLVE